MGKISAFTFHSRSSLTVIIRTADKEDAEGIINVNKSVLKEEVFMLRNEDEAEYNTENVKNDIEDHLSKDGCLYLVAETGNKIAGYLEFSNGVFKKTLHSGMLQIYLLSEYREEGIGYELLKALIEWAEKNPVIEKLTLNVFSTNQRAINLYVKSGFKEEGRCPKDMKFNDGTYADSVLMYKFVK